VASSGLRAIGFAPSVAGEQPRRVGASALEVAIGLRLLAGVWLVAVVAVALELWLRSEKSQDDPALAVTSGVAAAVAGGLWLLSRYPRHLRDRRVLHLGLAPAVPTVFAGILLARTLVASSLDLWIAILAASYFSGVSVLVYLVASTGLLWLAVSLQRFATGPALAVFITLMIWGAAGLVRWQRLRLEALAALDPLTGVANRLGFEQEGAAELGRARREHQPLALAVLDLDDFKGVNDSAGHAEGDRLLQRLSVTWKERLGTSGMLARLGGDEFVVLLPSLDAQAAIEAIRRLRAVSPASFSAGLAVLDPDVDADDDLAGLLRRADRALYEAKAIGKATTVVAERARGPRAGGGARTLTPEGTGT